MEKTARLRPEWKRFRDETTGAKVLQWTSHPAMHHHFYFTNPTLSSDGATGYFVSYRTGHPNLFRIDLAGGEITQLSRRTDLNPFSAAPSRTAPWIYYSARNRVRAIHTGTGEDTVLCQLQSSRLGNCSLSADGRELALSCRYDDCCELALVETATGHVTILTRAPEIGHVQFCPQDANLVLYSGSVTQRIWLHDRRTGAHRWVYPQAEGEWIVHESWLGGGQEIIFAHWPRALCAVRPDGTGRRTIAPFNAWHPCSHPEGTQIVCDTNHPDGGLQLVDARTGRRAVLCHPRATQRGTQWGYARPALGAGIDTSILRSSTPGRDPPPHPDDPPSVYGPQWSHPHPTFAPNGRTVVFTSDRDRWSQVYQVEIPVALPATKPSP